MGSYAIGGKNNPLTSTRWAIREADLTDDSCQYKLQMTQRSSNLELDAALNHDQFTGADHQPSKTKSAIEALRKQPIEVLTSQIQSGCPSGPVAGG